MARKLTVNPRVPPPIPARPPDAVSTRVLWSGDWIRTSDLRYPKPPRYQAAPRPDASASSAKRGAVEGRSPPPLPARSGYRPPRHPARRHGAGAGAAGCPSGSAGCSKRPRRAPPPCRAAASPPASAWLAGTVKATISSSPSAREAPVEPGARRLGGVALRPSARARAASRPRRAVEAGAAADRHRPSPTMPRKAPSALRSATAKPKPASPSAPRSARSARRCRRGRAAGKWRMTSGSAFSAREGGAVARLPRPQQQPPGLEHPAHARPRAEPARAPRRRRPASAPTSAPTPSKRSSGRWKATSATESSAP